MLSPLETERLNLFLQQVERLQLRFPIADIASKTGFDKGHVSKMYKGQKPLSDNFLSTFKKAYQKQLGSDNEPVLGASEDFKEKYYRQLEETNRVLQQQLDIIAKQADAIIQNAEAVSKHATTILNQQETIKSLITKGNPNGQAIASL